MLILSQDGDAIYDFDKCACIYVSEEENKIYVLNYAGETAYPLGKYDTKERCIEIVKEIFALMECTSKYDMPYV